MTELTRPFAPEWVSTPGDTIADLLEERDWTQAQLADRMGYTTKHISLLINGKAPITEEAALKLEHVLGSTASFWLKREAQYRAQLANIEEQERLQQYITWLDELPVKALMNQGIIPKCRMVEKNKPALVRQMLRYFGVASPDEWRKIYVGMEVAFRRTREDQSNVGAISAWIRCGELVAEKIDCPKFNKSQFQKSVREIRSLTTLPPQEFRPRLDELCWNSGVILVLVPSVPGAHVSGMARWLNPHKALIQLSLYGKQNDRFWFTLFHEAAHILLHDKKDIFLDELSDNTGLKSQQEEEADAWARDYLIPPEYANELKTLHSKEAVRQFSECVDIHPGIVVGRLQHDGIVDRSWMNGLKESFCLNGG
ncbi:helix-turn-helix domain-containing protein [Leptolyngbya sp. KIOST-1]|uniref:helix-turn-helix domain-containing protein n=1 Tax=Leptolyngbya sp. KIOST-1 TaxID=1229172 RepID=UPI00056B2DBF|nr:helix-turn-helix domain-containing protein [Leptolyngbya sp. KIOST-1]